MDFPTAYTLEPDPVEADAPAAARCTIRTDRHTYAMLRYLRGAAHLGVYYLGRTGPRGNNLLRVRPVEIPPQTWVPSHDDPTGQTIYRPLPTPPAAVGWHPTDRIYAEVEVGVRSGRALRARILRHHATAEELWAVEATATRLHGLLDLHVRLQARPATDPCTAVNV